MVAYCLIFDAPDVSGPKRAQERKKDKHSGSKSEVSFICYLGHGCTQRFSTQKQIQKLAAQCSPNYV